jgi:hypothetical protein
MIRLHAKSFILQSSEPLSPNDLAHVIGGELMLILMKSDFASVSLNRERTQWLVVMLHDNSVDLQSEFLVELDILQEVKDMLSNVHDIQLDVRYDDQVHTLMTEGTDKDELTPEHFYTMLTSAFKTHENIDIDAVWTKTLS